MTCIVGLTENGVTYLGGDSRASNGYMKNTIKSKKVFKLKDSNNLILGFSGAVRDLNVLQYAENLIDKRDEPNINEEYIVTKFIPNVIRLLNSNARNTSSNGVSEWDSYFLLAYKDNLWKIGGNYEVFSVESNYQSIGSGCLYAYGSMKTTEDMNMTPIERIHKALQVASTFDTGVAPPFYIINTENDEVIEFQE